MKQNILITGASGFIGSHIHRYLLKESSITIETFNHSAGQNITNREHVERAVKGKHIILHFASHAVGRKRMSERPESAERDMIGLENIAESSARHGTFLIFPSTTLVYGNSEDTVLTETSPCHPLEEYGALKLKSELLLAELKKTQGLHYAIARIATVIGRAMPSDSLIALFILQAKRNEKLTIIGPGTEKRSFISIDDLTRAISAIMRDTTRSDGEIFNMSGKESTSLKDLAELLIRLTNSSSEISTTPATSPPSQNISIEKAKKILDWEPHISLEKALEDIIGARNTPLKSTHQSLL